MDIAQEKKYLNKFNMNESFDILSEEFRKYLIEVVYEERCYFTIWGTDLADGNIDKWLVDETESMLLFSNLSSLRNSLRTRTDCFDNENMKKWINHPDWRGKVNSLSNFDLLLWNDFNHNHPSLADLYTLVGLFEDFAIQRHDIEMMSMFKNELFMQFKDEAANTFLWEGQNEFDNTFDFKALSRECLNIHRDLKGKISFMK